MLWIDPSVLPSDLNLNYGTQQSTPLLNQSVQDQADFNGTNGRNADVATTLNFNQYIIEDVGGESVPSDMLGYTTGLVPMGVKWQPFQGETLIGKDVPNSAVIFASEQYGDVGLSNANEVKVAQVAYQANVWTPHESDSAVTFISPGFNDNENV